MTKVKDVLVIVALLLVIVALSIVTSHLPRWSKSVDLILLHTDKTVGEFSIVAKNTNASSISTKQSADLLNRRLPVLLDRLEGTVGKANTLLDTTDSTMHEVRNTVQASQVLIEHTDERLAEADRKLDAVVGHATTAIDSASGLMQEGQIYLRGPLTRVTDEAHDTLTPTKMAITDFQQSLHSWLYPPKQSKAVRVYKFTKGILGLSQGAYYTIKIAREN